LSFLASCLIPVLPELPPEGGTPDTEKFGGLAPIPVATLQRFKDPVSVEVVEGGPLRRPGDDLMLARGVEAEIQWSDLGPAGQEHGALEGVLELPDVARPGVEAEQFEASGLKPSKGLRAWAE
jgi:hypothetical protein